MNTTDETYCKKCQKHHTTVGCPTDDYAQGFKHGQEATQESRDIAHDLALQEGFQRGLERAAKLVEQLRETHGIGLDASFFAEQIRALKGPR